MRFVDMEEGELYVERMGAFTCKHALVVFEGVRYTGGSNRARIQRPDGRVVVVPASRIVRKASEEDRERYRA